MNNVIGKEGFIWWWGVVENRVDPEMMGRVQVRCFGWHTEDKEAIPTETLPWAHPVIPVNSSNVTHTPKEGDWVFGFFADGMNAQHPVIMGVLTGYPVAMPDTGVGFSDPNGVFPKRLNEPSTNRLARGRSDGTVIQTRQRNQKKGVKTVGGGSWDEPAASFKPQYPLNHAHESESGHAIELDDTPGVERLNLAHMSGTFTEVGPDGSVTTHIIKDCYRVVMGADYVSIEGHCNVTVGGDCNLKVGGNLNVEASKNINMAAKGSVKIKAGGKLMMESGSTVDLKASGAAKIGAGGKLSLKGKSATVQGNTVALAGKVANKVMGKHGIGKIIPQGSASSPSNTGLKTPS